MIVSTWNPLTFLLILLLFFKVKEPTELKSLTMAKAAPGAGNLAKGYQFNFGRHWSDIEITQIETLVWFKRIFILFIND